MQYNIFCTFPKVAIVRCSSKYLFLKYGRKIRAGFLEMLEAAIFFQGFARVNGQFFKTILQTYSDMCIFCSAIQYIVSKKQPLGIALQVSADSSEIVFDESHFMVKLHSFLQPLLLPRYTFPPSEAFVPHSPQVEQFPKLLTSRHIRNSLVYLSLDSESQLDKSKEFNNQGLKVNRNLNTIFFFCHQKNNKKQTSSA